MIVSDNNILSSIDELDYVDDYKGFEIYIDMSCGKYYAIKTLPKGYLIASDYVLKYLKREIDEESKK